MNEIIKNLTGNKTKSTPVWLMRQAGRYMREYLEIKKKFADFSQMCRNSDAVTEITLQPIKKFNLDAAIIFSDILYIMDCLKIDVKFVEDKGPILQNNNPIDVLNRKILKDNEDLLMPVYKAIKMTKNELISKNIPLIGFAGAPWTLATYLVEGNLTKEHIKVRNFAYKRPQEMKKLINILSDLVIEHMINQVKYGVDVLQIFDTHSNFMDHFIYQEYGINAISRITEKIKNKYPNIPISLFTKSHAVLDEKLLKNIDCLSFSSDKKMSDYLKLLPDRICFQGNLDPMLLVIGDEQMKNMAKKILEEMRGKNYIFNLGHGVLKQTPVDNVKKLIDTIRKFNN